MAFKQAEDNDGIIVRLWETAGRAAHIVLRAPLWRIASAARTDLVENGNVALQVEGDTVALDVAPYALTTVRLRRAAG